MPYYESLYDGPVKVEPVQGPAKGWLGFCKNHRVLKATKHYAKGEILELFPMYIWDTVKVVRGRYVYERRQNGHV